LTTVYRYQFQILYLLAGQTTQANNENRDNATSGLGFDYKKVTTASTNPRIQVIKATAGPIRTRIDTKHYNPSMSLLILLAHPNLQDSRINKALIDAATASSADFHIRDLYALYPHGFINLKAEQAAIENAQALVLQHPFYWYSVPALLKEWIDVTLTHGWAFGGGGTALKDKPWAHAVSTGGSQSDYDHPSPSVESLLIPLQETAKLCNAQWAKPFITPDASSLTKEDLAQRAQQYVAWLNELRPQHA
jgi:glutathione-regulated potassium-efflux system ancillary protein KefG